MGGESETQPRRAVRDNISHDSAPRRAAMPSAQTSAEPPAERPFARRRLIATTTSLVFAIDGARWTLVRRCTAQPHPRQPSLCAAAASPIHAAACGWIEKA